MKKRAGVLLSIAIILCGCENQKGFEKHIERKPLPTEYLYYKKQKSDSTLLKENKQFGYDFRDANLAELDLSQLDYNKFTYNSQTRWPKGFESKFDDKQEMQLGKQVGLSLQEIHEKGITGKNIGIAILDQPLLVDHEEYKDQLVLYEEIIGEEKEETFSKFAKMHGCATASAAVGKTVGVAPSADLYFIAPSYNELVNGELVASYKYYAQAIERIIEVNKELPKDKKIRIISVSWGFDDGTLGYQEVKAAVKHAEEENIAVFTTGYETQNINRVEQAKRRVFEDPNDPLSYEPEQNSLRNLEEFQWSSNSTLFAPSGGRTYASPNGKDSYVHYSIGGRSFCIPYITGVYALACQVDKELKFDDFLEIALRTGSPFSYELDKEVYDCGVLINPKAILDEITK